MRQNSFDARSTLEVGGREFEIYRLDALADRFDVAGLPFSLKVLLENLLRTRGRLITGDGHRGDRRLGSQGGAEHGDRVHAGAGGDAGLHRCAGIVDLAAMREAMATGRRPREGQPAGAGRPGDRPFGERRLVRHARRFERNVEIEYERNGERYQFLRWGQSAFDDFKVVPPGTGIVIRSTSNTWRGW